MNVVETEIIIVQEKDVVFDVFFRHLTDWWPKDYTWSKSAVKKLEIERRVNGLCKEIGPFNFRCDWGRVLDIRENEYLELLWQIDSNRVPEPNPDKGSKIRITFDSMRPKSNYDNFRPRNSTLPFSGRLL